MPDIHTPNEAVATEGPPISISDAEMERLLDEATSLSQEIIEETGEAPGDPAAEEDGVHEIPVAQPIDLDEPEPTTVAPPVAEQSKPLLPDLLQEPPTNEGTVPRTSDPPGAPRRSERIETRDEEIARKSSSETSWEEPSTPEDAQEEDPHDARSVTERLTASCRITVRSALAVPIGIANGFLMIFVVLDRPFRNVSPGLKWMLGMIALATLLAGIAAWILPDLMNQNPFFEMERYTKSRGG